MAGTWRGNKKVWGIWEAQSEATATPSTQGRQWSQGHGAGPGGHPGRRAVPWPPEDSAAHFLLREPLLFSLSADRCFFTFSSLLFLLCRFSYTSSLCLQRGTGGKYRQWVQVRRQHGGLGTGSPLWPPHLTGDPATVPALDSKLLEDRGYISYRSARLVPSRGHTWWALGKCL